MRTTCNSTLLFMCLYIFAFNTLTWVICTELKDDWTLVRKMGFTEFNIKLIKKFKNDKTQTYETIIEAPIGTVMHLHESETDFFYSSLRNTSEWKQLSMGNKESSALYGAKVTTEASEVFLPPVMLTYGSGNLDIDFDPFVTSVEQNDFKFNDCQFQVERKDELGSTMYKMIVRGCDCNRSFSASVGKQTSSGFEETAGLSASYFFPVNYFFGSIRDDQTSSIFINRTALAQDGVQIQSLKFLIIRDKDSLSDLIMRTSYEYILT